MAKTTSVSSNRARPLWTILLAILAASGAAFVWRGAEKAIRMQSGVAGESQLSRLRPQKTASVVVEVTETSPGELRGHLLEKEDDTDYTRARDEADIRWNATTAIVMGQQSDVRPGAIIHVTGTVTNARNVEARQIVILTGYVQVK